MEVSATHYNHISAAITQDSRVYMWGQCRGQSVVSPTETPFISLHDVFACFATPSVTYLPMETEVSQSLANTVSRDYPPITGHNGTQRL